MSEQAKPGKVIVIVNGKECQVDAGKPLSYRAIAELAGETSENPSMTWRAPGYEGRIIHAGEEVWPSDHAVFNVADTSNA